MELIVVNTTSAVGARTMTHDLFLVSAAFLACAVEMVEALTIVLAVGVTRGWRSAIIGVAAALGAPAVVVAALGPALARAADRRACGSSWARSCWCSVCSGCARRSCAPAASRRCTTRTRSSPPSDSAAACRIGQRSGIDWYTFTVSFKGVFLEGLEVAFIVVTFGGAQHNVGAGRRRRRRRGGRRAAWSVSAVHRPLSRVPGEHDEVRASA